jgi:GAF domain-containing protein
MFESVHDLRAVVRRRGACSVSEAISTLLSNLRELLGMDIVLVAEFVEGHRIFRHVDVDPTQLSRLAVGQSAPLEDTYCQRVIDGRLPPVMSDTAAFPETHDLVATRKLGIGAYLSAPVVLTDGKVYGTLCCISHQARSALGCRQVDALRSAATLVSAEIEKSRRLLLER